MKIYVHHHYTYELFWYFFHASRPLKNIPTWFSSNRYNKNNKVNEIVNIEFNYDNHKFEAIFCADTMWDNSDGYHIWDYTIHHYENKNIGDRGWNVILGKDMKDDIIPKLNNYSAKLKDKISCFFIDWELGDAQQTPLLNKSLNPDIVLFKDELIQVTETQRVSFTHILWSYIFPNTINLREYYYIADYLKYKSDYKYKINYPIRRIIPQKHKVANRLLSYDNKNINVTLSSFNNYYKHSRIREDNDILYDDILSKTGEDNTIKKRGYNINDWGGEFNDNNMNEFMWKLLTISDLNLIHEPPIGYHINEKSFMHILSNKPFLSVYNGTFKFYNEILSTYGYESLNPPTYDMNTSDKLDYLNKLTDNDIEWDVFMDELKFYVSSLRKILLEIMHTKNGYLDFLIQKQYIKKNIL